MSLSVAKALCPWWLRDHRIAAKQPALGSAPALNLPPIQKRTLSNGLSVWLVEAHEVPLVQVNLLLKAGAATTRRSSVSRA